MSKWVTGNYRIAIVNLINEPNTTKPYAFALFDTYIICGDYVLCDTSYGYKVAHVIDIVDKEDYDGCIVTREIICKVNLNPYLERKAERARKKELEKLLDDAIKIKNQSKLYLYEIVAANNPEIKVLLDEYKANPF